jgi:hypothetical protein
MLRLMPIARKFGLGGFTYDMIRRNYRRECAATESEVELLSMACDDERLHRQDVPKVLGKSYRRAYEDGDFERIKTLKRTGIYSKISAILLGEELRAISDE